MNRRRFILGGCLTAWLALAATGQDLERIVTLTLTNGLQVQGVLLSEDERAVTVREEHSGGTITTTTVTPRGAIANLTFLDDAELALRARARAYANLQRYQLNPNRSYSAEYYQQVIENVFRPFLESYPDAPEAATVAAALAAWQDEARQVAAGQVRYRGRWLDAPEARQIMVREEADELVRQARALLSRGAYDQAIERVHDVDTPAAKALVAETYQRWWQALETEQTTAQAAIQRATAQIQGALQARQQHAGAFDRRLEGLGGSGEGGFAGASLEEVAAFNRAQANLTSGSNLLQRAEARLQWVNRQLTRLRPHAERAGVTIVVAEDGTTSGVVAEPIVDPQAPRLKPEADWNDPSLLRGMREFGKKYWMPAAVVLLVVVWYFTRRLGR